MKAYDFFISRRWRFSTDNLAQLLNSDSLTDDDLQIFNFDVRRIEWNDYVKNYVLGIRRYVFKEENMPPNDELVPLRSSDIGLKPWHFTLMYLFLFLAAFIFYFLVKFGLSFW